MQTKRVALVIQYVGTKFSGWQRQLNHRTVQAEIEDVLSEVLQEPTILYGAGRTDTGVHAAAQVAHFNHRSYIPAERWASILNSRLPEDISIRASAEVPLNWHARFSASWRRYRYSLYTDPCPNLFVKPYSWHYYKFPLSASLMQEALDPLLGRHHLTAFHRAQSSRKDSWVDVQDVQCRRRDAFVEIEIQANGFLYGMVRLLVGLLVEVGSAKRSVQNFRTIWMEEQRELVKYAAPAKGLCLLRVGYLDFPFDQRVWFDTQPLFNFNN
jgi:tRNA pseudouridine38-40 synthase